MIALDTNLIVRLLTNDDPHQAQKAARLIDRHRVYVPKTVLLETEWVLRYAYYLEPGTINAAFRKYAFGERYDVDSSAIPTE